jgi:hypothetical protein
MVRTSITLASSNRIGSFDGLCAQQRTRREGVLVHLGSQEIIGYTTDDGAFLRMVRGFHPHSKAELVLALDRSRHFNFALTFDNGRESPNSEYLNKLMTGIKILY